tara:strand:- start:34822 stop:36036 length:1215 start_codon:yes stop_codon:yes gene_type:complete
MILEMKVPSPGESINEVEIAEWLVEDGDYVEKDQAIAEVDSDKATLELPAEESGVITLKAEVGDAVEVGAVVCLIDTSATKDSNSSDNKSVKESSTEIKVPVQPSSLSVKSKSADDSVQVENKISQEEQIDSSSIRASAEDILIKDKEAISSIPSMGEKSGSADRTLSRKKLSMLRRKVADRLVAAKNESAMLTTFNEVDMTPIFEIRKQFKAVFSEKHGVNLGFMSFFTLAVVRALKLFPAVNSMIDGKDMISYDFCDVSIAVSGPKGLMVPVIRNAEKLTFKGVELEVKRLAVRARDGLITVDEMTGGTFTISNGGVFGSMLSTPIINPPQSGILGMHNIIERPVAVSGRVEIRPMMYVALSYDHRIIDGKESVGFLVAVKEALENPKEILMNNLVEKALEL